MQIMDENNYLAEEIKLFLGTRMNSWSKCQWNWDDDRLQDVERMFEDVDGFIEKWDK